MVYLPITQYESNSEILVIQSVALQSSRGELLTLSHWFLSPLSNLILDVPFQFQFGQDLFIHSKILINPLQVQTKTHCIYIYYKALKCLSICPQRFLNWKLISTYHWQKWQIYVWRHRINGFLSLQLKLTIAQADQKYIFMFVHAYNNDISFVCHF